MVIIETKKKELQKALMFLNATNVLSKKKAINLTCEITVMTGKIQLAVPGSYYELNCKTSGVVKATIPLIYLIEIIKSINTDNLQIKIKDNFLHVEDITVKLKTCYIEDDRILRTIKLPANYTDIELLKLTTSGYTMEELDFNNLIPQIIQAQKNIKQQFNKLYKDLIYFGFSKDDIKMLLNEKHKIDFDEISKLKIILRSN